LPFIQIAERFNGPTSSAHGGYTCGRLAKLIHSNSAVAVTLLAPPPLGSELRVASSGERLQLWHGEQLLATATTVGAGQPAEPLGWAAADQPEDCFAGFRWHPFASCFVCGTERPDGMRLLATPVPGRPNTVAAGWTPAAELADEHGRLVVSLTGLPRCGERHVVVGCLDRQVGRTAWVRTALYDDAGTVLATGQAQWLSVDPTSFSADPASFPASFRASG
jgi:hypothetical protein